MFKYKGKERLLQIYFAQPYTLYKGLFDNSRAYIDGLAIQKELVFCRTVLTDNKFELIEIEIIQIK